jgi:parallel beta-helix repeat protein
MSTITRSFAGGDGSVVLDVKAKYGAVGDGVADDTAAIGSAIAALTAGAELYFPPGDYLVTAQRNISGKTRFAVVGNRARIKFAATTTATAGEVRALNISGCSQFTVQGLSIDVITQNQSYCGIYISSSSDGTIRDCKVNNARHTGIAVFDTTPGTSRNILITGCTVEYCKFEISTNGYRVRIIGNHIADYWPTTAEAIANGGVWNSSSIYYDGILLAEGARECVVTNNTIVEVGQGGVYTQAVEHCTISNNTVSGCLLHGIEIGPTSGTHAAHCAIVGNTVKDCSGEINLVDTDYSVVSSNIVYHSAATANSGIAVQGASTKNTVIGNVVHSAGSAAGILVASTATTNQVLLNSVTATTRYSINSSANSLLGMVGDAKLLFGQNQDVGLFRVTTGLVGSDLKLYAGSGLAVGHSTTATTVGTQVRRMQMFDAAGNSLGYVPIYDA